MIYPDIIFTIGNPCSGKSSFSEIAWVQESIATL